jgi:hypothetical protein
LRIGLTGLALGNATRRRRREIAFGRLRRIAPGRSCKLERRDRLVLKRLPEDTASDFESQLSNFSLESRDFLEYRRAGVGSLHGDDSILKASGRSKVARSFAWLEFQRPRRPCVETAHRSRTAAATTPAGRTSCARGR